MKGNRMNILYWEDFAPGQVYGSGTLTAEAAQIKAFAAQFDPQPFHLDETAAQASLFGGLAASGWHTAALTMKLIIDGEFRPAGGVIGAGVEELRWPRPTRPGDVLSARIEVLETRLSAKRPDQGLMRARIETRNAKSEIVQSMIVNLLVARRPAQG